MIMRLRRYLCLAIFLAAFIATTPLEAQDRHTLWQVQSPTNTVYLLGSLHMLKPEHYPLEDALEGAFSDARHLVTEADLDELESPQVMGSIMLKAAYGEGYSLKTALSPESYGLVENATADFAAMGVSMQVLNGFKPWFVAVTIVGLRLQKLGFNPANGVDRFFYKKAKAAGMGLHALETSDFQINLLSTLSDKNQELMLLQTLRDLEVTERLFGDIYAAWRNGDVSGLDRLLTESFKEYPDVYEKLIVSRNQNWVPQIETFLEQDENYLVVVGAGHLIGDQSVVRMLELKGHRVTQQ
jgi:uncharacterized protein